MRAASATCRASSGAPSATAVCQESSRVESALRASPPAFRTIASTTSSGTHDPELRRASTDDGCHLVVRQRLELDDGAAGEEGGVDLEVGVLGRRADQRQQAALDAGQEGVLLALVEAVDLVEEEDRARPVRAEPVAGALEDTAHVVDAGGDGGELLEHGARGLGDDSRERRLADSGRAVEDHRRRPVALDREPERRSVGEHVPLADELVERARADALRERRRLALVRRGGIGEEVGHAMSVGRRPAAPAR